MKLAVDSNIVFAGLLREGTTRRLLIHPPAELLAPEWMLTEIRKYRQEIADRAEMTVQDVELLLGLLTASVEVSPSEQYESSMEAAGRRIGPKDPGDVPFLALAIAANCDGIWTQNVHHFEGAGVDIWTTERLVAWVRSRPKR